jgi:hypothetical protein
MASNIVPGNIDGTYPVAGQDNSSQGFRDNFTAIKNNFTEAKTEIENLQSNKASTNASSSFADNIVSRAQLKDTSETVYPHGTVSSGSMTLNHENGHYQTATITADCTLAFSNFPSSGQLGRIILDVQINSGVSTITLPSATIKADNVAGSDGTSDSLSPGIGRYLWEFMTPDGGTTVLMHELGKQYA